MLMLHNYDIKKTLSMLEQSNIGASYEIVQMINQMTSSDAKIEMLGYLIKLTDPDFCA